MTNLPGRPEIYVTVVMAAVTLLVQSSAVLIIGLVTARLLRRFGPAVRSAVYRATLACVALAPIAAMMFGATGMRSIRIGLPANGSLAESNFPISPPVSNGSDATVNRPMADIGKRSADTGASPAITSTGADLHGPSHLKPPTFETPHIQNPLIIYQAACAVWVLVAICLTARICVANILIGIARRRAITAPESIVRKAAWCAKKLHVLPPVIRMSSHITSPCLVGWLRPLLFIPVEGLGEVETEVLLHEMAHHARRDCQWQLLGRMTAAVLWFQPLVWILVRRMERNAEEACDDIVLFHGGDRTTYARRLIELAEQFQVNRTLWGGAGVGIVTPRSGVGKRVARLLDGAQVRRIGLARPVRIGLAVCAIAVGLSMGFVRAGGAPIVQESPPSQGGSRVEGRVVTPDGKPAARVNLSVLNYGQFEPEILMSGESDEQGRFAFDHVPPGNPKSRPPQIIARAPGYSLHAYEVVPGKTNELRLEAPTRVTIVFLETDGKPIEGLRVAPIHFLASSTYLPRDKGGFSFSLPRTFSQPLARTTDSRGTVTFEDLPRNASVTIQTDDERYANPGYNDRVGLIAEDISTQKTIRLEHGASVSGRVTYGPAGAPAAGIHVGVQGTIRGGWGGGHIVETDASGSFRAANLTAGEYNVVLYLTPDVEKDWTAIAREAIKVEVGSNLTGIDLTLIHGVVIRGTITKGDTGEPFIDSHLNVYAIGPAHPRSGGGMQSSDVQHDGSYVVRVPPGKQEIILSGSIAPYDGQGQPRQEVTVAEGQDATVDFALPRRPGKPVSGSVVDAEGKPVPDVVVMATSRGAGGSYPATTKTDAAGKFQFEAVAPESTVRVRQATQDGAASVIVQGGETSLRLQIARPAEVTMTGTVVDSAGKPVPYPRVRIMTWYGNFGESLGEPLKGTADGHYTLRNLSSSFKYVLNIEADGFGESTLEIKPEPGVGNAAPVTLEKADGAITGRVVDMDKRPIAGMPVALNSGNFLHVVFTDDQGKFSFPVVAMRLYNWKVIVRRDRGSQFSPFLQNIDEKIFDARS
ncbi:MAG TPA: M56 family metallopeptidase, partial [Tepidisphaeraceae bacterium]